MRNFTSEAFNSSNPYDLAIATNMAMGGWFGHLFLIGWFIIVFLALSRFGIGRSFAAASFLTFGISVLLLIADLIPQFDVFIALILASIGIIALYVDRG